MSRISFPASVATVAAIAAGAIGCGGEDAPSAADLQRSFGTPDAEAICDLREGSCSDRSEGGDRGEIVAAVRKLQRGFLEGDAKALCALMTRQSHALAGSFAHGSSTKCTNDVRHGFGIIEKGNGWRTPENPRVTDVEIDGDEATAVVEIERGWSGDVAFVKQDGAWKLDAFFGMPVTRVVKHVPTARRAPFPAAGGEAIRAVDRTGKPCSAMTDVRAGELGFNLKEPLVSGGCRTVAYTEKTAINIVTAFGDFKFGECALSVEFVTDGSGRTWVDEFRPEGTIESGCSDVYRCENDSEVGSTPDGLLPPWKGRLVSDGDGGLIHRIDACIHTCVGYFIGQIEMRLRPGDKAWRYEADDAGVGTSGLRLDGDLVVERSQMDLARTASP